MKHSVLLHDAATCVAYKKKSSSRFIKKYTWTETLQIL